jgi:hypothetical protein
VSRTGACGGFALALDFVSSFSASVGSSLDGDPGNKKKEKRKKNQSRRGEVSRQPLPRHLPTHRILG